MAEIPVERKSVPWWIWAVLALLALGALIWLFNSWERDDPGLPLAPVAPVGVGSGNSEVPIRDVALVIAVPDRRPLVGRRVEITNVPVLDVVGDRAFWIGTSPQQRLFVVLKEVPPPGSPTDPSIDINPGQVVSLTGNIRAMPDARTAEAAFGAPGAIAAREEQIYLFATAANVQQRAATAADQPEQTK